MSFFPLTLREFEWKQSCARECSGAARWSPVCWLVLLMPAIVSLMMAVMEMTGMALASADMSEVYGIVGVVTKAGRHLMDRVQTLWEADSVAMIGSLITVFWIVKEISLP